MPLNISLSHSRSLKAFSRSCVSPISIRPTVSETLGVKYWRDLKIGVRVRSRSLNIVPFESLGKVSYSHSIVTMAVYCIVSEI